MQGRDNANATASSDAVLQRARCGVRRTPLHLALGLVLAVPSIALAGETPHVSTTASSRTAPVATATGSAQVRGGDGPPDAADLATRARKDRDQSQLGIALGLSQRARQAEPGSREAIRVEVSTLARLGAAHLALEKALAHRAIFTDAERWNLRADATMADIREARNESKRLEARYLYAQRQRPLEKVLAELDANLKRFPAGSQAHERTLRDRVYVLRELDRMHECLAQFGKLQGGPRAQPEYVQRAAADAYLKTRQPERAAKLYAAIIKHNPKVEVDVYISWYYALIEGEHYRQAGQLLARIKRTTPLWIARGKEPRAPNYEYLGVDQLNVLDAAYRRHEQQAEALARTDYRQAPRNSDMYNQYATILRWRGWPTQAEHWVDMAAAYAPKARSTRINRANDARDQEHYDRWRHWIVPLAREFPKDTEVARSLAELDDRRHASMSAEYTLGHSGSNAPITGKRDQSLQMRVNTPWTRNGWRAYAAEDYHWGAYEGGNTSISRLGVGGEWRWSRKHAWAQVSQSRLSGRQLGVELGWSQWLGDHWRYQLGVNSFSPDTPLRATRENLRGRSAQAELDWRGSESTSASLSASRMKISDGNRRVDLTAQFSQRVQASAHHLTRVSLLASAERNDVIPNVAYFNPERTHSYGVSVEHDWITWRRYERSFTQRFVVTGASEWQKAYGSAAGVDLQYMHEWKLSRTWELHYGLGWGSHVFDGTREHRVFAVIGVSGVF